MRVKNGKWVKRPSQELEITLDLSSHLGDVNIVSVDDIDSVLTISNQSNDDQSVTFTVAGGTKLIEYLVTVTVTLDNSEVLTFEAIVFVTNNYFDYYGSIYDADEYFALRVNHENWTNKTDDEKLRALVQASRSIDRLNFAGAKTTESQYLQFPRTPDTDIPIEITYACYEEAFILIDGTTVQERQEQLRVTSQQISTAKETYDLSYTPENVVANIISHDAWAFLAPFLRDPREIKISRV